MLRDRVIVIVGGTTGLGLSAARACAAAGAWLVVVGRNADSAADAARALGHHGIAIAADATDPEPSRAPSSCVPRTFESGMGAADADCH